MALILVLLVVSVAGIIALSFLNAQSTTIGIAGNIEDYSRARFVAESGLRFAISYVADDAHWRSNQVSGEWAADAALAGGTVTISGEDGADTDGDGIIEGDGDLTDEAQDLLTLTVTGRYGNATHVTRAVITPVPGEVRKVLMVVPNPDSLSALEEGRKAWIEGWYWEVTLIDDNASASDLDAAVAEADMVYITRDAVVTGAGSTVNWPVGVFNESGSMIVALGIAENHTTASTTSINVIDGSHAITEAFGGGGLTVAGSSATMQLADGDLAPGATTLANAGTGDPDALIVMDSGGMLYGASTPGLSASYWVFSNSLSQLAQINFESVPTATGTVDRINQPSTNGAGWPGGPNDRFAIQYSGSLFVPSAGTWTFYTNSDDGSALYIDGTKVVDNDGLHGMTTRNGTISLTAGAHAIETRAFENGGGYGLIAYWRGPGVSSQTIIPDYAFSSADVADGRRVHFPLGSFSKDQMTDDGQSLFRIAVEWAAGVGEPGLIAEYFADSCCPANLADIDWSVDPTMTEIVSNIDLYTGGSAGWIGGPSDDFGIRYTGQVTVPQDGTWTFYTNSDDGSRLWIDGAEVVENDGLHSMRSRGDTVDLTAGPHDIEVRAFERSGDFGIIASWRGPGVPTEQVIPSSALSTGATRGVTTYKVAWQP